MKDDKQIVVAVPVKLTGASEGVKQGGRLVEKMRKVNVLALPKDLPDFIEVNIEPLEIGDSIRVRDINIDGVTMTDQPSNVIVGVRVTRKVEVPVEEEAAAAEGAEGAEGEAKEGGEGAPAAEEKKEEAAS